MENSRARHQHQYQDSDVPVTTDVEHLAEFDTRCVHLKGRLETPAGYAIGEAIGACVPAGRVLIDLGETTVRETDAVVDLVGRLTGGHGGELAVSCPHPTSRAALRRCGLESMAAVFASRGDALQALVMQAGGLGDGWVPLNHRSRARRGHLRLLGGSAMGRNPRAPASVEGSIPATQE